MSYCECDWDDCERPDFFSVVHVNKARKVHKCAECNGPIFTGESYKRVTGKWNGDVDIYRTCASCLELEEWAKISVPCFCWNIFGELHERVKEMVDDVAPNVPGFFFEYGRRMVRLKRRKESLNG